MTEHQIGRADHSTNTSHSLVPSELGGRQFQQQRQSNIFQLKEQLSTAADLQTQSAERQSRICDEIFTKIDEIQAQHSTKSWETPQDTNYVDRGTVMARSKDDRAYDNGNLSDDTNRAKFSDSEKQRVIEEFLGNTVMEMRKLIDSGRID